MKDCMAWQRARSDDQIEQREATILAAAAELFDEHRYEAISLVMIGKQAKFTRSNLYRYFKTKEDIYLRLLAIELEAWFENSMQVVQEPMSAHEFVDRWQALVLANPRLLKLMAILDTVLEENASDEAIFNFKRSTARLMQQMQAALVSCKLFADEARAGKFLLSSIALICGIYPKLTMPERVINISEQLGMSMSPNYHLEILNDSVYALYQTFCGEKVK